MTKKSEPLQLANRLSPRGWSVAAFVTFVIIAGGYYIQQTSFAASSPPLTYCKTDIKDGIYFASGSTGSCVEAIQYMVNSIHAGDLLLGGRWTGTTAFLATDGDFGSLTTAGVKAAQRAVGISADGVVGPTTMSALCAVGGEEVTGSASSGGSNHNRTVYGEEWAADIFGQAENADNFESPKCPKPFGNSAAL